MIYGDYKTVMICSECLSFIFFFHSLYFCCFMPSSVWSGGSQLTVWKYLVSTP